MKRSLYIALVAVCLLLLAAAPAAALEVQAESAVLIDAENGRVIFEKNADQQRAVASTTKIFTALLVLENIDDLTDSFTLPDDFVNVGESSIYLEPGETHTYEDLLYALMLNSANDAAQALAIGVSGSEEDFVALMNERSDELGLTNSHWDNPHGLDSENHYSSARDLALITLAAIKLPMFNTLITTDSYTLPWAANEADRVVYRHNKFNDVYEGADGVKTGYTALSGPCLVGSATRDGMRLIGVVLNSEDHYGDMVALMDFGFNNYEIRQVAKKGDVVGTAHLISAREDTVDILIDHDVNISVELGSGYVPEAEYDFPLTLEAPFAADVPVGTATYTDSAGNKVVIDLYPATGVERYTFTLVFQQLWRKLLAVLL